MSDSEEPIDPIDEGDDLFGDEDEEADGLRSSKERVLDDDDLASDPEADDRPRHYDDADETERVETVRRIMDATAYRHPIPKPSDGVVSAAPQTS
jgi:RNA polymerase-associated protein LEO1